jgi:hypothetical protein
MNTAMTAAAVTTPATAAVADHFSQMLAGVKRSDTY